MSYVNAEGVLPKKLVEEIQKYVDGQLIYIPRKSENSLLWGEKNGTKEKLAERNQMCIFGSNVQIRKCTWLGEYESTVEQTQ